MLNTFNLLSGHMPPAHRQVIRPQGKQKSIRGLVPRNASPRDRLAAFRMLIGQEGLGRKAKVQLIERMILTQMRAHNRDGMVDPGTIKSIVPTSAGELLAVAMINLVKKRKITNSGKDIYLRK